MSVTIIRKRNDKSLVNIDSINRSLINEVIKTRRSNYFIDWQNEYDMERYNDNPNIQAALVSPLIKDKEIKGVAYITVPLKEK